MTTCDQVNSLPCRISRPSADHRTPRHAGHLLELLRVADRGGESTAPVNRSRVSRPVRCAGRGAACRRRGSTPRCRPDAALEIATLDRVRHGGIRREQESGAHRHARRAVGQRGREPAAVEESAGRDHRHGSATASSTDGSNSVVATGPVWPPPSPPWTITASAPHPATFLACLARPDRRNHHHACLFELRDQVGLGRQARTRPP